MPGAEQVIAKLRPRIRRCYERGLASDPSMAGSMLVHTKVAANGEVDRAVAASVIGLSSEVSTCIARVIGGATFERTASGSTLDVPVKMVQQAR
jgi:L-cystine uptake protein TcyP (sodium:dicarboxylate symporter family)